MAEVTPVPTDLVKFVKRFPGLTASGISQLMRKRSDWASGSLCRLAKAGRIRRRSEKGMTRHKAWRYYPLSVPSSSRSSATSVPSVSPALVSHA
jgi:hypothetical protein